MNTQPFNQVITAINDVVVKFINQLDKSIIPQVSSSWNTFSGLNSAPISTAKESPTQETDTSNKCTYIMKKGKRIGEMCSVNVISGKFCSRHRVVPHIPQSVVDADIASLVEFEPENDDDDGDILDSFDEDDYMEDIEIGETADVDVDE
jgi:hypothetical protein